MKMDVSRKEVTIPSFKLIEKNEFKFDILIYVFFKRIFSYNIQKEVAFFSVY